MRNQILSDTHFSSQAKAFLGPMLICAKNRSVSNDLKIALKHFPSSKFSVRMKTFLRERQGCDLLEPQT